MDHAQEARDLIEVGIESLELKQVVHAQATLAMAQVHATLALAEQQRIANLIDIAMAPEERILSYVTAAAAYYALVDKDSNKPLPEIAEALGLKGDQG